MRYSEVFIRLSYHTLRVTVNVCWLLSYNLDWFC